MKCKVCRGIFDIHEENVSITVRTDDGFRIDGISLMLNGVCQNCQKKN